MRSAKVSAAKLSRLRGANQPSTNRVMADHLKKFGLVEIEKKPGPFGKTVSIIGLSDAEEKIARILEKVSRVMEK